ncbi:hypothetical protein EJB05_34820 [Eragrostis curvula]|uniref:Retrovirus-related Pol polyprotein from transposon TNT 1-94-like beta-barrel domain-containing protein n=1 Tax=Eragrostis curvula TaxID=38414 RepID=A0A5J9U602_9POAL|nr:hypothetical protein EJB05_34820 [Eragrostis curvula]
MSSSSPPAAAKKKDAPKERKDEVGGRICSVVEVDPAREDPQLLETIREKNKDALMHVLDPSRGHSQIKELNTAGAAWYLTTAGSHHVTGNLDLLTDITPVSDRWVRDILGIGPPFQVLARGSVNSNGIVLQDVWYVPGCDMNVISGLQLGLTLYFNAGGCSLLHPNDKTVVGEAHTGDCGLLEVDFINLSSGAAWYIASNVSQHMTGNLELLTNFNPIRPSYTVQTHTGARLQVCGRGSVKTGQFNIPNVSYVPGLGENIISICQLTDTGFSVTFGLMAFLMASLLRSAMMEK